MATFDYGSITGILQLEQSPRYTKVTMVGGDLTVSGPSVTGLADGDRFAFQVGSSGATRTLTLSGFQLVGSSTVSVDSGEKFCFGFEVLDGRVVETSRQGPA